MRHPINRRVLAAADGACDRAVAARHRYRPGHSAIRGKALRALAPAGGGGNRQGADGIPAVAGFVAARDDHTLLCSFAGILTINPLVYEKLPYDPDRDLVPIVSIAENFIGIAVSHTLNVKTLDEFIALARAQPRKLNWAATPAVPLYAFVALQNSTGIEMVQVSYREFAPMLQDVGEGRIQAVATGLALLLPQVQAGKIRLLMVTSRQRSSQVPDVPTASESGYPELTFDSVVGFYGWRDMPVVLKERIAADVRAVATDPVIAARVASSGSALRREPGRVCRSNRETARADRSDCADHEAHAMNSVNREQPLGCAVSHARPNRAAWSCIQGIQDALERG